jgi:hypothetical protein
MGVVGDCAAAGDGAVPEVDRNKTNSKITRSSSTSTSSSSSPYLYQPPAGYTPAMLEHSVVYLAPTQDTTVPVSIIQVRFFLFFIFF